MSRLFDVRAGEARGQLAAFAGLLLLIIGAHTILETARDTLLLSGPGPRALGLVYIAIAAGTLPAAAVVARAGTRFGQRRTLAGTLAVAIAAPALLFLVPASHVAAMATYVMSGILGSIVVPQFWTLVGTMLTVGQGRRLFGLIAGAGVVGGVLGPLLASAALLVLPVKALLLVSSGVFVAAAATLSLSRTSERTPATGPRTLPLTGTLETFHETPFLKRIALVVFLSTSTFLALDYLFKSTIARTLPHADIGRFIAHYYVALNLLSLVVQLSSSTVIRRLGVLPAMVPTPLLLLGGALLALVGGAALPGVLLVKGIDGGMRYSIHRVTGELMYLPVPPLVRQRAKPLIDGGLARVAQTITGAGLLVLGGTWLVHPVPLATVVAVLAAAWLVTVLTMRRPYLGLLRSAITSGSIDAAETPEPLDLETTRLLVQCLASGDPREVDGAMVALSRRGRSGLIPALVLLHHDESILKLALELFGESSRSDWFAQARRLLDDPRESVRVAAARALARHEQLDAASLAHDVGSRARGYAAVRLALRDTGTEVAAHPCITSLLTQEDDVGQRARLGMLAAIADAPRTQRLWRLLATLSNMPSASSEHTELLARAATRQQNPALIPRLISQLSVRQGREAVRTALVSLGDPALVSVLATLRDHQAERRLRLHIPKTLARFASPRAAAGLLTEIETDPDDFVRNKAIGALRTLVSAHRIRVDRKRAERLAAAELEEHFTHLTLRHVVGDPAAPASLASSLLAELLDQQASHDLEHAFTLLQIANPRQGVHDAYIACRSDDPYVRATAAELIDEILRRRDQQRIRDLFRVATDELSRDDRVQEARALLTPQPRTRDEGLAVLVAGNDEILAALALRVETGRRALDVASTNPVAEKG